MPIALYGDPVLLIKTAQTSTIVFKTILNDGSATRISHPNSSLKSAIDLSFCSPDLAADITWKCDLDPHSSFLQYLSILYMLLFTYRSLIIDIQGRKERITTKISIIK